MKKVVLGLGICLLFAGCGGNKVVCTRTEEAGDEKVTMEISATLKDGNVTKATTTMEFSTEDTAKEYAKYMTGSKRSGKKVTSEEEAPANEKVSKKEFIESMEDSGFKCK